MDRRVGVWRRGHSRLSTALGRTLKKRRAMEPVAPQHSRLSNGVKEEKGAGRSTGEDLAGAGALGRPWHGQRSECPVSVQPHRLVAWFLVHF